MHEDELSGWHVCGVAGVSVVKRRQKFDFLKIAHDELSSVWVMLTSIMSLLDYSKKVN